MKPVLMLILPLFSCAAAWAQITPPPLAPNQLPGGTPLPIVNSGLTFDAKSVSSGGRTKTLLDGNSGMSYANADNKQTHQSKIRLEVHMHNMGVAPANVRLEWFFVAKDVNSKREYIWDNGQMDTALTGGADHLEMLESTNLTQTSEQQFSTQARTVLGQTQVTQISSADHSGGQPAGWIVRMWAGDQLVRVRGSSSNFEDIGRDQKQLQTMQLQKPAPTIAPRFPRLVPLIPPPPIPPQGR
jgi:hypothetical protein